MDTINCIFCGNEALDISSNFHIHHDVYSIECKVCGRYRITYEAYEDIPNMREILNKDNKRLYCGYIREVTDRGHEIEPITRENCIHILASMFIPETLKEQLDKFILFLYRRSRNTIFGGVISFNLINDYSILYAKDSLESKNIIKEFLYKDLYRLTDHGEYKYNATLTAKGIEYAEALLNNQSESNKGFVAMWFHNDMFKIFNEIKTEVDKQTNYELFIIPLKEHNQDINDEIIAEIRRCRFMIADFTGHRGGVYYEAGFAYGLGKEVIFSCRQDWFNKYKKPHFDVEHRNFIIWANSREFGEKLVNRIKATII